MSPGNEKFTLFYGNHSGPYKCFSQWYPCQFSVYGTEYNCAEQFMMACKARLFNDAYALSQILKSDSPRKQKYLGRHVVGYNDTVWNSACEAFVYRGNLNKFKQNEDIYNILISTRGTTLVECSQYDKKWGIGLSINDPKCLDRNLWRGQNLLGKVLTKLRIDFIGE